MESSIKVRLAAVFAVAVCAAAHGQKIGITEDARVVIGSDTWIVSADDGGKLQIEKLAILIPVTPGNPGPDPDPDMSETAKKVQALAAAVDEPQVALGLSAAADIVAKSIASGQVKPSQSWQVWSVSSGMVIRNGEKDWKPFETGVAALYNAQVGGWTTAAHYAKFFADVSTGCGEAGGDSAQQAAVKSGTDVLLAGGSYEEALAAATKAMLEESAEGVDWENLFRIIMMIIEMIMKLFPPT